MPQFEPTWFASQIFWLVIIFYVFYRLLKSSVIPHVSGVLAERDARIQGDLDLAQRRRRVEVEKRLEGAGKPLRRGRPHCAGEKRGPRRPPHGGD